MLISIHDCARKAFTFQQSNLRLSPCDGFCTDLDVSIEKFTQLSNLHGIQNKEWPVHFFGGFLDNYTPN